MTQTQNYKKCRNESNKAIGMYPAALKYGDFYHCVFATWDSEGEKFALNSKREKKIVLFSLILHFVYTTCQIVATAKKSDTIETQIKASVLTTAFITALLFRFDLKFDHVPVLNYIFSSKGNLELYIFL